MSGKYDDIIELPHYQSKKRPRMSNYDRAAQFAPFAALTGYGAAVAEAGRLTERRLELSDERKLFLDQSLQLIEAHIREQPQVTITCFQPDLRKSGGSYIALSGRVRRIDRLARRIIFTDGTKIPIDDIYAIEGELLKEAAEACYEE